MDSVEQNIARAMLSFQAVIPFKAYGDPLAAVKGAISSNPKIVYYLHSCSLYGTHGGYEIRAQYIHKDTSPRDVYVADSEDECLEHICRCVGDYKKRLITVVKNTLDVGRVVNEFHIKHAPFYSNLVKISTSGYHAYADRTAVEFGFEYRIGQVKLNMMERQVDDEVERIASLLFTPDMPDTVKVYLAHNYLAVSVLYRNNKDNPLDTSYTQSAYGALIKKECVCQGFAEAFKRIMDRAGVECEVVCGQTVGSSEHHAWNTVTLGDDGSRYHIDVTWDAAGSSPDYTYYCKNDAFFVGNRTWNKELCAPCNGRLAVLSLARRYVYLNKGKLLAKGIDERILDL